MIKIWHKFFIYYLKIEIYIYKTKIKWILNDIIKTELCKIKLKKYIQKHNYKTKRKNLIVRISLIVYNNMLSLYKIIHY